MKNKSLAMLLTLVMPGLGYIYTGKKILFAVFLFVANIANIIWWFTSDPRPEISPFLIVGLAAYYVAILIDVYAIVDSSEVGNINNVKQQN